MKYFQTLEVGCFVLSFFLTEMLFFLFSYVVLSFSNVVISLSRGGFSRFPEPEVVLLEDLPATLSKPERRQECIRYLDFSLL